MPRGFELLLRDNAKPEHEEKEKEKTEHFDDLRDAIEKYGDLILLGEPVAGKTTTLWRLMLDSAQRGLSSKLSLYSSPTLPVLLSLGRYDGHQDVLAFIRSELALASRGEDGANYPAHQRLAEHLNEYLDDGRLLLLFDALNEMPLNGYGDSIRRLDLFKNAQRGNRFIFTCRALDYSTKLDVAEATIEELDEKAQEDFLTAYFATCKELFGILRDEHEDLLEIGRNPYMLLMIGLTFPPFSGRGVKTQLGLARTRRG